MTRYRYSGDRTSAHERNANTNTARSSLQNVVGRSAGAVGAFVAVVRCWPISFAQLSCAASFSGRIRAMATRYGPYVPPVDYGTTTAADPPADYNNSSTKSHYPFSTFPDAYNSAKNSHPKDPVPSEPPIDYDNRKPPAASPRNEDKLSSPQSYGYNRKSPVSSPTNEDKSSSPQSYGYNKKSPVSSPTNEDKSSSPQSYGHGAVPLPDYNSPDVKRRAAAKVGDRRYGPQDFSQQRSIGVPVLPPMSQSAIEREPGKVGAGQNRAWLHHLKNHRKFDTLNSFRSVDDCPICQAMDSSDVALTMRHRNRRPQHQSPIVTGQIYQPPQGPIYDAADVNDHRNSGETKESLFMQKLNSVGVVVARAVQDRVARKPEELTVVQGELLEVGLLHSNI
uniref:Uncharacterized protein n=1 Tax=Plectus sambesii TaxID=2011161 RepID=A0A914XS70_9BILA